jgi:REP element-mobilizing transposase RayT
MCPYLDPARTTWHITFGTYGTRLHGDDRPTVDRTHNQPDQPFITSQPQLKMLQQQHMRAEQVLLNHAQCHTVQSNMHAICQRGQWNLHTTAASGNHVHILIDAPIQVNPKDVHKWLKRWTGEALDDQFGQPASETWWAKGGSTKPVKDQSYFDNAYHYITKQRTM